MSWMECLKGVTADGMSVDTTMDTTSTGTQSQHKLGGTPELEVR
jgi:hypothetical protein